MADDLEEVIFGLQIYIYDISVIAIWCKNTFYIYILHIYLLFYLSIHHWFIFNCFPRKSRLWYQKATTREICNLLLHTAFEAVYSAPLYWVPNIDTIKYLIAAKLQLNLKHCDSNIASLLSQHWAHPHLSAPLKGPVTLIPGWCSFDTLTFASSSKNCLRTSYRLTFLLLCQNLCVCWR